MARYDPYDAWRLRRAPDPVPESIRAPDPVPESIRAPDLAEPIIAARSWYWQRSRGMPYLVPLSRSVLDWSDGDKPAVAHCAFWRDSPSAWHGKVPGQTCTCGLYAVNRWGQLAGMNSRFWGDHVIGRVAMWGKVVPHVHGWRAQYAKPIDFVLPNFYTQHLRKVTNQLADRYNVPVRRYRYRLPLSEPWEDRFGRTDEYEYRS